MSSSSTTTEPTVRETPEVSGDDNANARAAVHSANKPGAAYAAAVANGESERAWIRRVVLLLTGQAFSLLGSSIVQYAIWWWIVLQTRTGSAMLLATLFGVVPQAIVSIFGGSWADRHSRKLLIMLPDMVIAVVTVVLSLSFAMGWASLTMIFVVLFIRSAGGGVQTPAVQSFIPDVVPSGKLLRVNSIYGVINSANMIVAPAVAAVLINTVPLWSILLVDVTTAIIGVGFVALIKAPKKSAEHVARRMAEAENSGQPTLEPMSDANADRSLIASVRRVFADLKDGFSYTWRRANLRNVVLGGALVCFVSVAPTDMIQKALVTGEVMKLCKSYRSTCEITDFAQKIRTNTDLEPVARHGEKPKVLQFNNEKEELSAIKDLIVTFQASAYKSLGIVCKTESQACEMADKLQIPDIHFLSNQSSAFVQGIVITSAHMAKGLEFDEVIIPQTDDKNYHSEIDRSMLYVAVTRAMHRLTLTYSGTKHTLFI